MTFWEHLDQLRGLVLRSLGAVVVLMLPIFFLKEFLFDRIIFAPARADFFLYRLLGTSFALDIINVDMASQFFVHLRVTFLVSLIVTVPYIIYCIWKFVSPALYESEKNAVKIGFMLSSLLFYIGVAVGYCIVFPLTVRFLGNYQVSESIPNTISLDSYISMFLSLILIMGLVFELPAVAVALSRLGSLNRKMLVKVRKYAVVAALILSAVITPSGDAFTMLVVAAPLYLLYEFSILLTKIVTDDSN